MTETRNAIMAARQTSNDYDGDRVAADAFLLAMETVNSIMDRVRTGFRGAQCLYYSNEYLMTVTELSLSPYFRLLSSICTFAQSQNIITEWFNKFSD